MSELESDIEHLEEVLKDFKGCDECRKDHERLLAYLKELLSFREVRMTHELTPARENKLSKISALAECIIDIAKTLDKDQLELIQAATSIYITVEQIKVNERILDDLKTKNDLETVKVVEENGDSNIAKGKLYFCESDNPEGTKEWCLLDPSDLAKIKRFFK